MIGQPAKRLDGKGRCCGRKPCTYKRPKHYFWCDRCHASFSPETKAQIPNWAFVELADGSFRPRSTLKTAEHTQGEQN